ncbi:uncharacterized protein LOC108107578 [Drosophila eugracilis]|uniref:uncharacterized protein LOC108107578 n=1 Tax=Drosophila eugracilis TaxID=29029 RepID=UPI0007E7935A|nr:uncharacterized protein LOC108107578 [Drosophila eugracilis]
MESQGDSESLGQTTKTTRETVAKCSFMITVGSDGVIEINSHNPENDCQVSSDGISSGNSLLTNKKQRFTIAVLKEEDSNDIDSDPKNSLEKIKNNIDSPDEMKTTKMSPSFIKICNKDLANRPSFVVLEDACARNRIEQNLEQAKSDQSVQCQTQQTSHSETSCHTGSQTDKTPHYPTANNSTQKGPKVSLLTADQVISNLNYKKTQSVFDIRPKGGNFSIGQKDTQQPHPTLNQHLQQQEQLNLQHHHTLQQQQQPTNSPYVTISFLPMTQTGVTSTSPVAFPCQQFLSATSSNISNCSCCTCRNCCPPRKPQVCQVPMPNGCNQFHNPLQDSKCCMLRTDNFQNSCLNSCGSCCPIPSAEPHSSMGLGGQFSPQMIPSFVVPSSNCTLQQQQPNIQISGCPCQPLCTCNQCSHYRMQSFHHPCCHCLGFFNNQQMYQSQQPPCVSCPIKLNQRRQCSSKGGKVLKACEKTTNLNIHHKKPEILKQTNLEPSNDQNNQPNNKKTPRSIGGAVTARNNPNYNPFYLSRYGRTCLILRPTSTALVPRLFTKRISRYTSVIAWPTKSVKSNMETN